MMVVEVDSRICTVGLTGGLASGKTSVAAILAGHGAAVLDADRVVHELYRPGGQGSEAVATTFGPSVLAPDGSVDRDRLGKVVLAESGALERLNQVVHPLVQGRIALGLEWLSPPVGAVVEAALTVETGSYSRYDLLAVVWCRPEQQLERALSRGLDRERAVALIKAQMSLEGKRELAHIVIDNSGDLAQLGEESERAWHEITIRCRG